MRRALLSSASMTLGLDHALPFASSLSCWAVKAEKARVDTTLSAAGKKMAHTVPRYEFVHCNTRRRWPIHQCAFPITDAMKHQHRRRGRGRPHLGLFSLSGIPFIPSSAFSPAARNQHSRAILAAKQQCDDETPHSSLQAHLGPPPQLIDLNIGEHHNIQRLNQKAYTIERISDEPHAFVLRSFLSQEECDEIIQRAEDQGMETAETKDEEGSSSRQNCGVAWVPSFPLESQLVKEIRSVLIQDDVASSSDLMVELLQVLKYSEGGLYEIHHDGEPRFLTVIYYLNGVGATWFPFATIGDWDPCNHISSISGAADLRDRFSRIRNGEEGASMDVGNSLQPGIHGVIVASRSMLDEDDVAEAEGRIIPLDKGDVLAFYNYEYVEDDDVIIPRETFRALHMGMPAEEEKIIANHWFCLVDS